MGPFQNENSASMTINNKHPYTLLMGVNFGENGNKYCTGFQEQHTIAEGFGMKRHLGVCMLKNCD